MVDKALADRELLSKILDGLTSKEEKIVCSF